MPRKNARKDESAVVEPMPNEIAVTADAAQAPAEAPAEATQTAGPADVAGDTPPKNWGPPYKAIYTNAAKGIELGENRRFKQRVFTFRDKPAAETIALLKQNGFTYRAEEKQWTIQANAASRELSDRLAQQLAGVPAELIR